MKSKFVLLGIVALCLILAAPAEAGGKGWNLRVFAAGIDPSLDETVVNSDGDDISVTAGTDLGFGASLEYQFTDLLGLEFGGFSGSPEVTLSADIPEYGLVSISDELSTQVLALDLNFHLTPNSSYFDVYLGAGVTRLNFGDLHFDEEGVTDPLILRTSNDLTWSAKANVGISLGESSKWSAFGGLRYIWADLEGTDADDPTHTSETFSFNTLSFSVGIGYHF